MTIEEQVRQWVAIQPIIPIFEGYRPEIVPEHDFNIDTDESEFIGYRIEYMRGTPEDV